MTIKVTLLIVSTVSLASGLAQSPRAHPVDAASPQSPDPCTTPVGSVRLLLPHLVPGRGSLRRAEGQQLVRVV